MPREKVKRITSIGGQALMEGIMMRGPKKTYISVRTKTGEIDTEELKVNCLKDRSKLFSLPLIRGIVGFIDSLIIGKRAMEISAEKSGALEDDEESQSKFSKYLEEKFGDNLFKIIVSIASVLGVALALFLFMFLPTFIYNNTFAYIQGFSENNFYRSFAEGIMKIVIFLIYIILCSQLNEIKRVFQYHGAEHKTIFCYESGEDLTVENVKKHSRFHPRCGTSFLMLMLIVGIIIGFFIPVENAFFRTIIRFLCVPLLVGIGYELIKICSKYDNVITRAIAAPGLWMQRITTKEPDDSMIEIAIASILKVIPENGEDIIKDDIK